MTELRYSRLRLFRSNCEKFDNTGTKIMINGNTQNTADFVYVVPFYFRTKFIVL